MKEKKQVHLRSNYHHIFSITAGERFIQTFLEESRDNFKRGEDFAQEWVHLAKNKGNTVGPIEFLSNKTGIKEDKLLATASKMTGVPIVDPDILLTSNRPHYIIDGLPMTLLHQTDVGAITLLHCIPFLERVINKQLLAKIYGGIKVNFTMTSSLGYLRHLDRVYNSGKAQPLLLAEPEDSGNFYIKQIIENLRAKQILNKPVGEDISPDALIEQLIENPPKKGSFGETDWWALTSDHPIVNLAPISSSQELTEIMPPQVQKAYGMIPIYESAGVLTVASRRAFQGTLRHELTNDLRRHCKIGIVLAEAASINEIITSNFTSSISASSMANKIELESTPEEVTAEIIDISELTETDEASITKLVQSILITGIQKKATDIHITAQADHTWVRYRMDGMLVDAPFKLPFQFWKAILSRVKIMSSIDIKYSPLPQDGKFTTKVSGQEYEVRVNTCPTVYGEKAVLRIQKKEEDIPTLERLGFLPYEENLIRELLEADHGLLIICGPTGSGKTTTLSAAIHAIDRKRWNVITAENPVEIRIPLVEQTPIDGSQMTFGKFIPAALRQDPDYIMIGETRDKETTEEVIRAAITGHVVMTTLHTNSAAGAAQRLIDMGGEPFLIADAMKVVIAQRLIRRLCQNCARPTKSLPSETELQEKGIKKEWLLDTDILLEPTGCKICHGTGYSGRIAIAEGYKVNEAIRRIIMKENANSLLIRKEMERQGGKSLFQHAVELAARKITSLSEALSVRSLEDM